MENSEGMHEEPYRNRVFTVSNQHESCNPSLRVMPDEITGARKNDGARDVYREIETNLKRLAIAVCILFTYTLISTSIQFHLINRSQLISSISPVKRSLYPTNCMDVSPESAKLSNATGGVFTVYPLGIAIAEVYCDTTTDGGGWTVFQRRTDGSVDFFLGWDDYVKGFGERQGEFWLGLEAIHKMTKNGEYEMRVDMIQTNGTYLYAQYESFRIGPGSDYYRLNVSGYTGNATDGMEFHNNMQFSTKDSDHDTNTGNCASYYKGAWWHKSCYYSHLNAQYGNTNGYGIQWWRKVTPTGWDLPNVAMYLNFSEMKFRKKQ